MSMLMQNSCRHRTTAKCDTADSMPVRAFPHALPSLPTLHNLIAVLPIARSRLYQIDASDLDHARLYHNFPLRDENRACKLSYVWVTHFLSRSHRGINSSAVLQL